MFLISAATQDYAQSLQHVYSSAAAAQQVGQQQVGVHQYNSSASAAAVAAVSNGFHSAAAATAAADHWHRFNPSLIGEHQPSYNKLINQPSVLRISRT